MACSAFDEAIAWCKNGNDRYLYPCQMFLTYHFGGSTGGSGAYEDRIIYARGKVNYVPDPNPSIAGYLDCWDNNASEESMQQRDDLKVYVQVFGDGSFKYQRLLNGKPIGGLPPFTVNGTCVDGQLLTSAAGGSVITIGVRRLAREVTPPR